MLRYLLLLLLPAAAAAQTPLAWSASRPLTASDFTSRPRPADTHAARTSTTINTGVNCQGGLAQGTAVARFEPNRSWLRDPTHLTPALLRHEQLHFDLTEVYARRLRQQLAALQVPCASLGPRFKAVTQRVFAAWAKAEDNYDRDTNHGLRPGRQAAWEAQTRAELNELSAFGELN